MSHPIRTPLSRSKGQRSTCRGEAYFFQIILKWHSGVEVNHAVALYVCPIVILLMSNDSVCYLYFRLQPQFLPVIWRKSVLTLLRTIKIKWCGYCLLHFLFLFCIVLLQNVTKVGVQIKKILLVPLTVLFCNPLSKWWCRHYPHMYTTDS